MRIPWSAMRTLSLLAARGELLGPNNRPRRRSPYRILWPGTRRFRRCSLSPIGRISFSRRRRSASEQLQSLADRIDAIPLPGNTLNLVCRPSSGGLYSQQREEPPCAYRAEASAKRIKAVDDGSAASWNPHVPPSRKDAPETCFSRQTGFFREIDNFSFFQVILQ
jgi:hypothetical protein